MSNLSKNIEIEILRGLSILLVFLFHFQITLFSKGYLGVDIFFVISGYLMAAIYGDMKTLPKVWDFFERRFNRLLPAYFTVLVLTLLYSTFVVLPHEQGEVNKHALWSTGFMPNIGFWMDSTYFNKSQFKPFLNFWSLGVELQFYVVVPVIVYLFFRSKALVTALLLGSLATYITVNAISPKLSFFMMPLRLWEFLAGFMIAKFHQNHTVSKPSIGLAALIFLMGGILFLSGNEKLLGWVELSVVLLTGAVIYFGLPLAFLNSRSSLVLQWLGKYSYSIYLLHFPVIVFSTYIPFQGINNAPEGLTGYLAILGITLAGSVALYHTVENHFRKKGSFKRPFLTYLTASILIAGITPVLSILNQSFFSDYQKTVAYAWEDRDAHRCGKLNLILDPFSESCLLTHSFPAKGRHFLLVGDSHADSIKRPLADVLDELGSSLWLMKQNRAFGNQYTPEDFVAEVKRNRIDTVILHSARGNLSLESTKKLVALGESNHFKVVFIYPIPAYDFHVPQALFFKDTPDALNLPDILTKQIYEQRIAGLNSDLAQITAPNFFSYPVVDYFCHPLCELADDQNRPFYFDTNHLTLTGARRLNNLFESLITS